MQRQDLGQGGWFRLTLAGLIGLVLCAMATGVVLERHVLAYDVPPQASAKPDFKLMTQAWDLIEKHYVDRTAIQPRRMTYAAIAGMVDSLGDTGHSVFLSPRMVRAARQQLQGHFAGIGAEVRMRDQQVVVVAPLDGTPAQKAGLRPGDVIFQVDGKSVAGQSLEAVVRKIRGPVGTKVELSIRAPHGGRVRRVTIVRAVIHVQSVSWIMVPGTHVADLRIAEFSRGTAKGLAKAIAELRAAGARAVVLDLRSDPGGLLTQAIAVASEFLSKGNVLLEKNAKGQIRPIPVEEEKERLHLPMVVLVNRGTASASEIVTGALRDAGRAVVVGERTFGTGTVLEEFHLSDGSALMLAVREWLTPDGHTFWHKGIRPGITVALSPKAEALYPDTLKGLTAKQVRASTDKQFLKALAVLRRERGGKAAHGEAGAKARSG